ncbi:MAG: ATP-binding protein [Acidobacteriota bacterium]
MSLRASFTAVMLMLLSAGVIFNFFQSRLTGPLFGFGLHPEVLSILEASLEDQRWLASRDPDNEPTYRQRFGTTETLMHRLQILEHSRDDIERRYQFILTVVFASTALLVIGGVMARQTRYESRLGRLQGALADLAGGRTDIDVGERRRDTIGRIATMIERTSRAMARDRRRLAALENLSAWQESARRHAHEIRTPLTGARLELTRLEGLLAGQDLDCSDEVREATRSVLQELERLGRFTQEFTSFARVPKPVLEPHDLGALVKELVTTFEAAWANLTLRFEAQDASVDAVVPLDRDMVRRVLVNLCDNSSLALGDTAGTVTLSLSATPESVFLDVADDGPGVDESIRSRLFEPYTTTRSIGKGMGLGLAICKKILLDHDGDLELLDSSSAGATFRLTFNRRPPEDAS